MSQLNPISPTITISGELNVDVAPIETIHDLESLAAKFIDTVNGDSAGAALNLSRASGKVSSGLLYSDNEELSEGLAESLMAIAVVASMRNVPLDSLLRRVRQNAKQDIGKSATDLIVAALRKRGLEHIAA